MTTGPLAKFSIIATAAASLAGCDVFNPPVPDVNHAFVENLKNCKQEWVSPTTIEKGDLGVSKYALYSCPNSLLKVAFTSVNPDQYGDYILLVQNMGQAISAVELYAQKTKPTQLDVAAASNAVKPEEPKTP